MMLSRLPARDRRALTFGVLAISSLWIALRGIPAWTEWREGSRAAAVTAHQRLVEDRALADALPEALNRAEERWAVLRELRPRLMLAPTPPGAATALARVVGEAAEAARLAVESMEVHPFDSVPERPERPARVSVEVRATGDIGGLSAFLESLEAPPYFLAIRRLLVVPTDIESPSTEAEWIHIEVLVEGLALSGSPDSGGEG